MSRFRRGLALAGQSWQTLRSHRSLAAFPILGAAMALVIVGPPAVAGAYLADRGDTVPGAALGALAVYLICFVSAFVGSAWPPPPTPSCAGSRRASAPAYGWP